VADFANNVANYMSLNNTLFQPKMVFELRLAIELLVLILSTDWHQNVSLDAAMVTKQVISDPSMLRERLEDAQTRMILGTDKSSHPHDFREGELVCLNTSLLPIGYASLTQLQSPSLNCTEFHQPFCWPFCIMKAIVANGFRMNTLVQ